MGKLKGILKVKYIRLKILLKRIILISLKHNTCTIHVFTLIKIFLKSVHPYQSQLYSYTNEHLYAAWENIYEWYHRSLIQRGIFEKYRISSNKTFLISVDIPFLNNLNLFTFYVNFFFWCDFYWQMILFQKRRKLG